MSEIMTKKQLAEYLQVTERTVDRMRKEGLPCFKVATSIRFNKQKVTEWLERFKDATEKNTEPINIQVLPEVKISKTPKK